MEGVAELKKGAVVGKVICKPLVCWVNGLRKVVFPNSGRWEKESTELYSRIKDAIQAACEDHAVMGE